MKLGGKPAGGMMVNMIDMHGVRRFVKYTAIGGTTFSFDLLLIWMLVELASVDYALATAIGFVVAVTVNYFIVRRLVFHGSERRLDHGYLYFISIAGGGALLVTGAVTLLVSLLAFHYLIARVLVACMMGMMNYLLNLHFNFKVVGKHH